MTVEREFLLDLLRSSLLGETGFVVPESIDWATLISEAERQGVAVLASDGLQRLYDAGVYAVNDEKEKHAGSARQ